MATPLEWYFALVDRVTGPSQRMSAALQTTNRAFGNVESAIARVDSAMRRIRFDQALGGKTAESTDALRNLGRLRSGLGGLRTDTAHAAEDGQRAGGGWAASFAALGGAATVARQAWDVVSSIGGTAVRFAASGASFLVDSVEFRENTLVGLQTILGTQDAARRVFAESQRIAQLTPFDTNDVITQRTSLILSGFTERQSRVVQAAASDIGAALGQDRMAIFTRALERINAEGRLTNEAVQELRSGGVNLPQLYQRLATTLHIGGTGPTMVAAVRAAITHGRVDGERAMSTILDVVGATVSHGALGSFSVAQSNTLGGQLSNLRSAFTDLIQGLSLEDMPGVRTLKSILANVAGLLSPATTEGKLLRSTVEDIVNATGRLFGSLAGEGGANGMRRAFHTVLDVFNLLWTVGGRVFAYFEAFGGGVLKGLGDVLGPVFQVLQAFVGTKGPDPEAIAGFAAIGRILGIVGGALGTAAITVIATFGEAFGTAGHMIGTVVDALERLWAWIQSHAGGGGILASVLGAVPSDLGASLSALLPAGGAAAPALGAGDNPSLSGMGHQQNSAQIEVHVHADGTTAADAEAIGNASRDGIEQGMANSFTAMRREVGA